MDRDFFRDTSIPAERLELVPETPYCVEDAAKLRV
jgi:RNA polymerase-binding transcription factor DksA